MLAALLHLHRGPLAADLHRFHGLRLATIAGSGFSVGEVADFVGNLPPDSAVARALNPAGWDVTTDTHLLRAIEHDLRVLAWQSTADARAREPQHYPVELPLTEAEAEAQKPEREFDAMPIEEMNRILGWPA